VARGAQTRPVWPVKSVEVAPGAVELALGAAAIIYMLFLVFCSRVREKEARVLRGFCSNIKSRIKRVIS
jgi:hypothetical protein